MDCLCRVLDPKDIRIDKSRPYLLRVTAHPDAEVDPKFPRVKRKACCSCGSSQKQVLGKGFLSNYHLHGAWKDGTFSPAGDKAQSSQAAEEYEWEALGSENA